MSLPNHVTKWVRVNHEHIFKGSFGKLLGSQEAKIVELSKTAASFQFVLPSRLEFSKDQGLSCSAAMAIFDDLSTIGFMAGDATGRPGVSVHLTTTLLRSVPVGTDLTLKTSIDKVGAKMGFTSMKLVLTKDPEVVVAVGRHVKYLPIGNWLIDNIILHPSIWPLLVNNLLYEDGTNFFEKTGLVKPFVQQIPFEEKANVFKAMNFAPSSQPVMSTRVTQAFCNPMRSMHGGAVAMSAELACQNARPAGAAPGSVVTDLSVVYYSALVGDITVEAKPDEHDPFVSGGILRRSKSTQAAAQFTARWGNVKPASS